MSGCTHEGYRAMGQSDAASLRLLEDEWPDRPNLNLALEEAVFRSVEGGLAPCTVRLWRCSHVIVLGKHQCPALEVDADACARFNVRVSRRITGGGAVYQDAQNLNFSIIGRGDALLIPLSIPEGFRLLGMIIIRALDALGIKAAFKRPNIIEAEGRKVSGLAGYLRPPSFLFHGTLLVDSNLEALNSVLKAQLGGYASPLNDWTPYSVKSRPQPTTTLSALAEHRLSVSEVKRKLIQASEEILGARLRRTSAQAEEVHLAEWLSVEKYSTPEWIAHHNPRCPFLREDLSIFQRVGCRI